MLGINNVHITPPILRQISEIDEFKGLWKGLDRHTTGLQLLGDVADYGAKFQTLAGPLKDERLTPLMIQLLHGSNQGQKGATPFRVGATSLSFSKGDKAIGALQTTDADQIEPLLEKLCDWVNEALGQVELHPLLVAAVFTAVFLQICPFDSGNRGVLRFILILILLKSGYMYAPYVSLASIMQNKAETIFKSLQANQASLEAGRPEWGAWLQCFLMLLQDQKDALYDRLYSKEIELKTMPALSSRIMALFKEHRRLQMKDIVKLTRGRRATIKLRIKELVDGGYVVRHGQGRATWYSLV